MCLRVLKRTPFSSFHESLKEPQFRIRAKPLQKLCFRSLQRVRKYVVFCVFFLWRGFGKSDKFGFFHRRFSSGAENTIKTVVSGTRSHEKNGHVRFSTFLLVFFDRFRASLVSTLLDVFMPNKLKHCNVPVLGKSASFGAFLRHVAEIPIKLVKWGNLHRCCSGDVPETPIKLVQNRVDRATAGPDANISAPIESKRQPSRGTQVKKKKKNVSGHRCLSDKRSRRRRGTRQ